VDLNQADVAATIRLVKLADSGGWIVEQEIGIAAIRKVAGHDTRPAGSPITLTRDELEITMTVGTVELANTRSRIVE
jgi:hypothetical protein